MGVATVIVPRIVLAIALVNLAFLFTELAFNVLSAMLPLS